RGPERGVRDGVLGQRLGAEESSALELRRSERREEDEALDAGSLGRPQEAHGRKAVQLLHPSVGLVADRPGQVDERVDAAQRLALQVAIAQAGQIAKRDLDLDAMATEPAWVADKGPDVMPGVEQRGEEGPADGSARPCKQDHAAALYPRIAT